mgnify:FL=1
MFQMGNLLVAMLLSVVGCWELCVYPHELRSFAHGVVRMVRNN